MLYLEYFLSISISRSLDIAAFVKLLNFIYLFILENHYVYSHSGYLVYGDNQIVAPAIGTHKQMIFINSSLTHLRS